MPIQKTNDLDQNRKSIRKDSFLKAKIRAWWYRLVWQYSSPHDIALGLAFGMFVGFLPIMGIQMIVVLILVIPFKKANKFAAASGVWVSNPLTFIPIYILTYWVGCLFYSDKDVLSYEQMKFILSDINFKSFIDLGINIIVPMFIGGAIIGLITAIITYFLTKYLIRIYRNKMKYSM